jgi:hypothetical protein
MQASAPRRMQRREMMPQESQMENQVTQAPTQGIETAQSNLPTQMAEGGIIGYANRGLVDDAADDDEARELAQLYGSGSDNDFIQAIMPAAGGSSIHPSAAVQMQPGTVDEDMARKYNVGNLRPVGFTYPGQVGVSKGGFAMFNSPEAGEAALRHDISVKLNRGLNTPEKFVAVYAPASDKNDTKAYAKTIHSTLGIKPGEKIPNTPEGIELMASAIKKQEGAQYATRNFAEGGIAHFVNNGLVGPTGQPITDYLADNPEVSPEAAPQKPLSKEAQAAKELLQKNAARASSMGPNAATSSIPSAPELTGVRGLASRAIGNLGVPSAIAYLGDKLGRASMNTMAGNQYFQDYSDPANGDLAVGNAILNANPKALNMAQNPTGTTPAAPVAATSDKGIGALNTPAVPMTSPTNQELGYDPSQITASGKVSDEMDLNQYLKQKLKDLASEKAESKKDREMNKYLALMQAGFGMMGGTSPYAAVNIGQGAEKGIGAYAGLNKQSQDQAHDLAAEELGLYKYGSAAQNAALERELKYGNKDQRLALGQATLEETKRKNAMGAFEQFSKTSEASLLAAYPGGTANPQYQAALAALHNSPQYKALERGAFPELASVKSDTGSTSANKKPLSSFEQ